MKTKLFSLFLALTIAGTLFASDINVKGIWYNFDEGTQTAEVTFKGNEADFDDNRYKGSITITEKVSYGGKTYDVTSIGEKAFYGCKNVTSVTLPNSIISIGKEAFGCCYDLSKINIPESVTSIGESAFSACVSILNLTVPSTVTAIGSRAFANIPNLIYDGSDKYGARAQNGYVEGFLVYEDKTKTKLCACSRVAKGTLKLPTTLEEIGEAAFLHCSDLESLTLPNSVTTIGKNAFHDCAGLISLVVPSTITTITEEGSAFYHVPNVIYEGTLTNSDNWGAKCLNGYVDGKFVYADKEHTILKAASCNLKGNVSLPNTVKTIATSAFASKFSKTTSVMMGTNLKEIYNNAFFECDILTSVVIPSTIKSIGSYAFSRCWNLTSIICEANTPPVCQDFAIPVLDGKPIPNIYVPANSLSKYKAASGWTTYADNIFPITAETSEIGAEELFVAAEDYTARIKWPKFDAAKKYTLQMNGTDFRVTYNFDGEGKMLSTAFGAPGIDGPRGNAQNLQASYKSWQYDVQGLEPLTEYFVNVVAEDAGGEKLFNKTKSFTTKQIQA
ncbi:MAG: leucine-rich repeat domain-containing protein, partial [Elusimicrobiaceae bacterium]|nr:leucine-rich repeat domain-containing protein [Elusimicrobiaceae bacterium]